METPTAVFCGVCGAALHAAPGQGSALTRHPLVAALAGGVIAGALAIAGLSLASGGSDASATAGAKAPVATSTPRPPATAQPARTPPTSPSPAATSEAGLAQTPISVTPPPLDQPPQDGVPSQQQPAPSPPPPPTSPPPPPPPTSPPAPTVPPQKTSALAGLTISGGHGSSHRIGAVLVLCYTSVANQYIRLYSSQAPSVSLRQGVDDGRGECFNVTVSPPTGVDRIRIDAYNAARTSVVDYAELSIIVVP